MLGMAQGTEQPLVMNSPTRNTNIAPFQKYELLFTQYKWWVSSTRNWGYTLPRVRVHKPFVKFHFDSISRGILFALVVPCLSFFLAKFKYNWTVYLILLFWTKSMAVILSWLGNRKEGDHIKKQFVLFLAELSTIQKKICRVQMALD